MEAVVAERPRRRLPPPALQAGGQRLPLVRGGEVHHRGGAPPDRRPGAGGEVVGGDGPGHLQIEVGVAVDKAGEQQLPPAVHHRRVSGGEIRPHGRNLLPLQQHVRPAHALAADHAAPSQQDSHTRSSSRLIKL